MKIEAGELKSFLTMLSIDGLIDDIKMDFGDEGLSIKTRTADNVCMMNGQLNKSSFKTYEKIGEIGVQSVKTLLEFLKRFGDEVINIEKKANMLLIRTKGREGEFILPSLEFIEDIPAVPKLDYDLTFKLNSDLIREAYNNSNTIGDDEVLSFIGKDKKLILQSGTSNKLREIIDIPEIDKEFSVTFGMTLGSMIKFLDGDISVSVKTNYPLKLLKKSENLIVSCIVAPIVTQDE